jgi:hypothetical protein
MEGNGNAGFSGKYSEYLRIVDRIFFLAKESGGAMIREINGSSLCVIAHLGGFARNRFLSHN